MKIKMKINKKLLKQIILYGIIGMISALLDFLLFTLMYIQFNINPYYANIISVHIGIFTSFILNRKYNFKKYDKIIFRTTSFYLTGLLGLGLSQALLWFGQLLSISPVIAKFFSIFIVAAVQFTINKLVTFNK